MTCRPIHTAILSLVIAPAALAAGKDVPALKPYSYHQGFEEAEVTMTCWASNGEHEVNTCGVTDEQAAGGKRSLKLDVSLKDGTYHYFGVVHSVPCAGRLKLSAKVLVAKGTTCRIGFGTNMRYPPTRHTGCSPHQTFEGPTDGWQTVEIDLVERGRHGAHRVMGGHTAFLHGDDVGAYLDRWSLFILGGQGRRAVVYVDDVRIEGEVPSPADYKKRIDARWHGAQKRLDKQLDAWRSALTKGRTAVAGMSDAAPDIQHYVDAIQQHLTSAEALVRTFAQRGYGSRVEVDAIEEAIRQVRYGPATVAALTKGLRNDQPFVLYAPPAITNDRFTPDAFPIAADVAKRLELSGCRGEYESASLLIYALTDLKDVKVSVGELTGTGGRIAADAVDVHIVKSWYQAARGIWMRGKQRLLAPELLLKDDRLIRVDAEAKHNYVRSTDLAGKTRYVLCSGPTSEDLGDVWPVDSATLLPVDIGARSLRQFWLTVRIPDGMKGGSYQGTVTISTATGSTNLPIELTVHDFDLAPSRLVYSIYYRGKLSANGLPTIGSEYKSEQQFRAELEDLKAHGVLYPTNYQSMRGDRLRRVLELRREVGLPTDRFYNLGRCTGAPKNPSQLKALKADVQTWIALCRDYGYEDVYFYGIDEARGERLKAQRKAWAAVQDAGGKNFVACYGGTFEAMGKLLNCAVLAGKPDPEEARKWHGVGSEAFCYAYPQVGNEEPETYRRNFGLVLWREGFDGAMDYAYQHAFGHIWNDFDHNRYRDHNFTYPTAGGVVGTIQWEGFREAVDDGRYVTTLEKAIKAAAEAKPDEARQAKAWLDALDPYTADLAAARAKMVQWIVRLR